MLIDFAEVEPLLRSPCAPFEAVRMRREGTTIVSVESAVSGASFPVVTNQPVLIDFSASVIERRWYETEQRTYSLVGTRMNLPREIKARFFGTARESRAHMSEFRALLKADGSRMPLLLMIGAGTRGMGTEVLYEDPGIAQIAFDVYPSPLTHFAADAHRIPLGDESVDGVCIQAVLEHVLMPEIVVGEIMRVLRPGGFVYAETPFMQQVHEGAYDFTRFTELGHRWLFRGFEEIRRGALGGPGLSLYWTAKYFFRSIARSKKAGTLLSLPFLPFAWFDRFIPPSHQIDGANGVYFLGRKAKRALRPAQIVEAYKGAQR
jgi:SAM-dependent methyltransferase